jgi:Ca2+-binding RTX toxin-like protein
LVNNSPEEAKVSKYIGGVGDDIFTGTARRDRMFGREGNDTLSGGDGDDRIEGGTGFNSLLGGNGNDTIYSSGVDAVDGGAGLDWVRMIRNRFSGDLHIDLTNGGAGLDIGDGSTLANIEAISIECGSGSDMVIGGLLGDYMNGGRGNDLLSGADGNDYLYGGAGNDTLYGGAGSDRLVGDVGANSLFGEDGDDYLWIAGSDAINGGAGIDRGVFFATSSIIGLTIDLTNGGDGTDIGNGTTLTDIEVLEFHGGSGADVITGGALDDSISTGGGNDIVDGAAGDDLIGGAEGDDILGGGQGDDLLSGYDGNDSLTGGQGVDSLTGGLGADRFVFRTVSGTVSGAADTITDFLHSQGDRIDLSAIDANSALSGDQAFTLAGGVFTNVAGQLIQAHDGAGNTLLQGDVNGDGLADFTIILGGAPILLAGDILL